MKISNIIMIWSIMIITNCSANVKNNENIIDYGLVIVSFLQYLNPDSEFCDALNLNVIGKFKLETFIKGDIKLQNKKTINFHSCEHWSASPYNNIDGFVSLSKDYDYKWLVLFVKKDFGYYILEKNIVFKLKNDEQGFCTRSSLIKGLLGKENEPLGEYIGDPVPTKSVLDLDFYLDSECETVKNGYIYLNKGIKL